MPAAMNRKLFTVGHSTYELEKFTSILKAHEIEAIADVRRFPGSRRHPQFNATELRLALGRMGIEYQPFVELGGRRQPEVDSPNNAWRNAAFRGYADYMQTPDFQLGLGRLIELAGTKTTATMCAESLPWRCHRSLISDAFLVRGWTVVDIFDEKTAKSHKLPDFAVVNGESIFYPK